MLADTSAFAVKASRPCSLAKLYSVAVLLGKVKCRQPAEKLLPGYGSVELTVELEAKLTKASCGETSF